MAPRTTEQNDRELNTEINSAIAGTEDEIFRDAMEAALDDEDGDTSLEEMGDGLEGDHLDEELEVEDTEGPGEDDEDGEGEDDEDEADGDETEGDDEEAGEDEQPQTRNGRQQPGVPSGRLREANERARKVEGERDQARSQIATLEARFNDLLQRVNSGQTGPTDKTVKAEAPAKPDMFTDPDGYEAWVLDQAETRAAARIDARLQDRDRRTQEEVNQRVDRSFNEAATGDRGFEFTPAYNALKSLDPKDPQAQKLVRGIFNSSDPQEALFAWWDENGGQDFRENIARQLGFTQGGRQRRDDGGQRQQRQHREERPEPRQQVRHEIRPAQRLRSLNGASGGGSRNNRNADPEMLDNSEDSVFAFATKR